MNEIYAYIEGVNYVIRFYIEDIIPISRINYRDLNNENNLRHIIGDKAKIKHSYLHIENVYSR